MRIMYKVHRRILECSKKKSPFGDLETAQCGLLNVTISDKPYLNSPC